MTIIIIILTSAISISAFNKPELLNKLQLNPSRIYYKKEWYRVITHGMVHADWVHLIINMLVLYSFGRHVEHYFSELFNSPRISYVIFYISSIIIASLTTIRKHRNNPHYNAVGASGAVSAIVFFMIFFNPRSTLLVYFIPMPAIIFGILYLIYSSYMSRKNKDNINHEAHFIGAVFGFIFPLIINPKLINIFWDQLF